MPPAAAIYAPLTPKQQELVRQHFPFVIKLAKPYFRSAESADLIAEGNLGLCIAASRFDPTRGIQFMTFAAFWIKAYLRDFLVRNHPVHLTRPGRKVFQGLGKARKEVGEDTKAIAFRLNVNPEIVEIMRVRLRKRDVAIDHIGPDGKSLEIRDETQSQEQLYATLEERDWNARCVHRVLRTLGSFERWVIQQRFLRAKPLTLKQIGDLHGYSREWIRQVEERALRKLKQALKSI